MRKLITKLWNTLSQRSSITKPDPNKEAKERLEEMLKLPSLFSKEALRKAMYQGFDNQADYEKYGDMFQAIEPMDEESSRFSMENYLLP